ncbi:MAG: hypothetical protein HFE77_01280 [Clostridiales bacterium]|nr:hypothetical protein [Clostridiales bacterium]
MSKSDSIYREYDWVGDQLMREEWDDGDYTYQLSYVYDENGVPEGVKYSQGNTTTRYYYITNAQGDIVALRKADNTLVGTYEYDAYGKILAVKDANGSVVTSAKNIMNINPLRYRGYYYDYDSIGRVKSIYTYDSDTGSVKTSLSFTYDTENRVTGYTYNDGSGTAKTVKNTYNSNGTQKSFTNGWGDQTNTFVYDSLQRLTKKTTAHSSESSWTYSKTYQYWDGASGVSDLLFILQKVTKLSLA